MIILGIESSCDETGVALYEQQKGLLAEALHSQVEQHAVYGGVVPELASRDHVHYLPKLVEHCLQQAGISAADITAVAYTAGPGLIGALMVGASFARAYAYALGVPAVPVHHMEGHVLSSLMDNSDIPMPMLAVLVSGGHTQLVRVKRLGEYEIIGQSIDDAIGEAFDKTAKMMGLPYPGGAILSELAQTGRAGAFDFPRPMIKKAGLDFSFSGLKTAALQAWKNSEQTQQCKADIALAFEQAAIDTLTIKIKRALVQYADKHEGFESVVVAGGVSANQPLRNALTALCESQAVTLSFPPMRYCTDNGAMIAYAGMFRMLQHADLHQHWRHDLKIHVKPRWPMSDLSAADLNSPDLSSAALTTPPKASGL